MKTIGIIAEYNPFHNGHAYQLRKAKEAFHADYAIIALSGNFVQRGFPAISDKFSRTAAALLNGADFVFEIPTVFATASAEYFAAAGIALFNALGCVDAVSFGCETPDLPLMSQIAGILSNEPDSYQAHLSFYLKNGDSFPAARQKAVIQYLNTQSPSSFDMHGQPLQKKLALLLSSPNNILALEYLKAIRRSHSGLIPIPIPRNGSGYHDQTLQETYCSAAAIRAYFLNQAVKPSQKQAYRDLSAFLPEQSLASLLALNSGFVTEEDFTDMLYYKLLTGREQGFEQFADCSAELSNRILHSLPYYDNYRGFCDLLKKKDVTYSRISRTLLHILLEITKETAEAASPYGFAPYLRLLGFRRKAAGLFGKINAHATRPLITKPAKAPALLDGKALSVFKKDVFASDLYYGILAKKSGREQKQEYRREMVIL